MQTDTFTILFQNILSWTYKFVWHIFSLPIVAMDSFGSVLTNRTWMSIFPASSSSFLLPPWPILILGLPFLQLSPTAAAAAKSLQSCLTVQPHRRQPTRLLCPWDSPGKNTSVCCHFLLQPSC